MWQKLTIFITVLLLASTMAAVAQQTPPSGRSGSSWMAVPGREMWLADPHFADVYFCTVGASGPVCVKAAMRDDWQKVEP